MDNKALESLEPELQRKLAACRSALLRLKRVVVAFSGGVDSTFLLALAVDTLGKSNVLAVTGVSAIHPKRERESARNLAKQIDVELLEVDTDEMTNPQFLANPPQRCYICKRHVMTPMIDLAGRRGFVAVVSGANADDMKDYRPGIAAGEELGIINPLLEAGLTKADIRAASLAMGLPTWDKPAAACLASRIPYGQPVTTEKLSRIEQAENRLRDLGFTNCRLRDHHPLARIEVPLDQLPKVLSHRGEVLEFLKSLGFMYVTLDLEGFRSGSLNMVLTETQTSKP